MIRVRRPFVLAGRIPTSKSWLNRALILRSMFPDLRIVEWEPSELDGEDVTNLRVALEALANGGHEFQIGESGTGLRFLLARLSLAPGRYEIVATPRLLERPHGPLVEALKKLGTSVTKIGANRLLLEVSGWPAEDISVDIDASESSQFASALVLAASQHGFQFQLMLKGEQRSQGYLEMTRAMVAGVKAGRKVLVAETDASSVATLACVSIAASHHVTRHTMKRLASESLQVEQQDAVMRLETLQELVQRSLQPDRAIFDYLKEPLGAFDADLGSAPDLFPCLAALAAFAPGTSKFFGAPHLRLKESDRIAGVAKLFHTVGITYRELPDGIEVTGLTPAQLDEYDRLRKQGLSYSFDPESDHRLAFAAAVLSAGGLPIEVLKRGVVSKSLPMFWTMIEGDAPRVAMIGHRGTGKTEAAKRWAHELGGRGTLIDLDREIERLAGQSTEEIFETVGETEFRWFEKRAWREVDVETRNSFGAVVVACGAGFDPAAIDDSWTRVWLRRSTDIQGRIFTDRPRLDKTVDPLTESLKRNELRAPRFAWNADRVLEIGEGSLDPAERVWVSDLFDAEFAGVPPIERIGGCATLMPNQNISETCERLLRWGVARIEIRDDLWSPTGDSKAWEYFASLPKDRLLISLRAPGETATSVSNLKAWLSNETETSMGVLAVDWAFEREDMSVPSEILEWAASKKIEFIASRHGEGRTASVADLEALEAHAPQASVIKGALTISNFKELEAYHSWMMAKPDRRVFLPMSAVSRTESPRWQWYRSWVGTRAARGLSFWREGDGSSLDQPTFSQWWRRGRFQTREFAAVLGDPVMHSRTPLEHDAFFTGRNLPIFAIPVKREDVAVALPFLIKLGLQAAAVTAPLKESIVEGRAINTLKIQNGMIEAISTDSRGFKQLWESTVGIRKGLELQAPACVWGGGGVLPAVKEVLPDAIYLRASRGPTGEMIPPDIVIWAAGESRGAWPRTWRPRLLVDLSYTENSMARAIALETGARYVSGLAMFEAQAAAQRKYWEI